MIPKIIHQTWKTNELPAHLKNWHERIKQLHPGWEIKLWTDADNLRLVKERFPHLLKIYEDLEYNIMRIDIIRYMYMSIFGGYYLDLDYELFVPFDDEISNTNLLLPIAREKNKEGKTIIGNCIFGSIPEHDFWADVLNEFRANPPVKKIYNKNKILKLTGPEFISEIYFRSVEKYNGTLLPRKIFHPNAGMNKVLDYKDVLLKTGARGIHHCEGSWLSTRNPLVYFFTKMKFGMS